MDAADVLDRVATLLERKQVGRHREQAFRRAADSIRDIPLEVLRALVVRGDLELLAHVGPVTAGVIAQVIAGRVPDYLARLEAEADPDGGPGAEICGLLVGDLHVHSDWSDGGARIEQMARKAAAIGHEYLALTDHSPRLTIARGLSPERLHDQLEVVARLNVELAPFRILTGIEVDILDDGSLDQEPDLLAALDLVVASVHSKLRMPAAPMTDRMVAALAHPHSDVLGHCTGRIVVGKGRPESEFDAEVVFGACLSFDKAVEINCRPERLDPPRALLEQVARMGCRVAISTDAHAVGQLDWQPYGCVRAAEAGIAVDAVVNAWPLERLLEWTTAHRGGRRVAPTLGGALG
jgi:putative hydrolase